MEGSKVRMELEFPDKLTEGIENFCHTFERRIDAAPLQRCPVDMMRSYLQLCQGQSCGKCVPCRVGLGQLQNLLDRIIEGGADLKTVALIRKTADTISRTADCAIGYDAANHILRGLTTFDSDIMEHLTTGHCACDTNRLLPCIAQCPARVDIPGYISLIGEGRYSDAIRLIRKDNPFPAVCGYVCEHPCEMRCRRRMVDEPINIRALKRFAADNAGNIPDPRISDATGKSIAVIGSGPCGMTAAWFLTRMGHKVTVYEQRAKAGGMLRYGIPAYRLPREILDKELDSFKAVGIEIKTGVSVGKDIDLEQMRCDYDAICISIGAHTSQSLKIENEFAEGVYSAMNILRGCGDDAMPIFEGMRVSVIGGGNVAMDAARMAKRLGASRVNIVYRRRKQDMTALPEEIEGAIAEGCEILMLHAPKEIEVDADGRVAALIASPQIVGAVDAKGRPRTVNAPEEPIRLPCDVIIIAIGQNVELEPLAAVGVPVSSGGTIAVANWAGFEELPGVFSGGDCVSGPATVVRAIAAGKVLASNIDKYLGFNHVISTRVEVPMPKCVDRPPLGRIDSREREATERQSDFRLMEYGLTDTEAKQEAGRCLRCDHFGFGALRGGRNKSW